MKKLFCLIAAAAVCLGSCDDEDKPTSAEKTLIETISTGQWSTNCHFIRTIDGKEQVDKQTLIGLKSSAGEMPTGGLVALYYDLIAFSCSPQGTIDTFDLFSSDGPAAERLLVRRGVYNLSYDPATKIARMTPNDRDYAKKGFYAGVDMRLRTLTPTRIELDIDINANTRSEWADYIDANTTSIRAVWTPADENTRNKFFHFESPEDVALNPIE